MNLSFYQTLEVAYNAIEGYSRLSFWSMAAAIFLFQTAVWGKGV